MKKDFVLLSIRYQHKYIEAGCDEAGRGSFAGPVFAAAVILGADFYHPLLDDSKKVTEENRNILREYIEKQALGFGVARVDAEEIDHINILRASFKAMHKAIAQLKIIPGFLLIDGNRFTPHPEIPHKCIVQGDGLYASIAAASILAKTYRDEFMQGLHLEYPCYHWQRNKGYGTKKHREAIDRFGLCKYHRKSYQINSPQLKML